MYSLCVTPSLKIRPFTQVYKVEELPAVLALVSSSGVKGLAGIKLVPRLFNIQYLKCSELADLIPALVLLISASLSSYSHLLVGAMLICSSCYPITNLQTHGCQHSCIQEWSPDSQIDIISNPHINHFYLICWQFLFPRDIDIYYFYQH